MYGKRQKQLSSDIKRIISEALQQDLYEYLEGAFVTVSEVSMTPDLEVARIRISVLQEDKQEQVLQNLIDENKKVRGIVGSLMRNKVRRIPQIEFYVDDSLGKVFEIERLLNQGRPFKEEE